jgi:hypothetical protein
VFVAGLASVLLLLPGAAQSAQAASARAGAHGGPPPLTFGVYPGGIAGGGTTSPVPNDPDKVEHALRILQGGEPGFLVRDYTGCTGGSAADTQRYLVRGRRLDLVLGPTAGSTMADWLTCVRSVVHDLGPEMDTLSVTLEANLARDATTYAELVRGVVAAKQEARELGNRHLQIGFDEVAFGQPDTEFWNALNALGGRQFRDCLDYVGIDVYPDVFFPVTATTLSGAVTTTLKAVRGQEMPIAGLPRSVPIRVAENGWPTIGDHTEAGQVEALRSVIETVNANRARYHVVSYELFDLRDALTTSTNLFDHFGILHDDYTPKPAFWTYRNLIRKLGTVGR